MGINFQIGLIAQEIVKKLPEIVNQLFGKLIISIQNLTKMILKQIMIMLHYKQINQIFNKAIKLTYAIQNNEGTPCNIRTVHASNVSDNEI